jgi:hypothetical protein
MNSMEDRPSKQVQACRRRCRTPEHLREDNLDRFTTITRASGITMACRDYVIARDTCAGDVRGHAAGNPPQCPRRPFPIDTIASLR